MNVVQRAIMKRVGKGFAPMMKHMHRTQGAAAKAVYEKYGEEALPIIAEVAGESGVGSAQIMQGMMPIKGMKDIGELFKMMDSMMEMGMEIIELSDNAIHFRVSQCVLGLGGTSKELCEAMMSSDKKMMSTLLGQEVETKILKSIAAGDEQCEVVFSKK